MANTGAGPDKTVGFREVLTAEHDAIRKRRALRYAQDGTLGIPDVQPAIPDFSTTDVDMPVFQTSGLALSGGGIRAAAFSLGVLQSLCADTRLIDSIDYLSTVSGGGYVGASLSAAMSQPVTGKARQDFPFGEPQKIEDTIAVQHLRDYSNYLLPRGGKSFPLAIAVVMRGLAANLIAIVAAIFLFAWLTVIAYSDRCDLTQTPCETQNSFLPHIWNGLIGFFGLPAAMAIERGAFLIKTPFAATISVFAAQLLFMLGWAIYRSVIRTPGNDVKGGLISVGAYLLGALVVVLFLDLQPLAVKLMLCWWDAASTGKPPAWWAGTVAGLTAFATGVAAFRKNLAEFLGNPTPSPGTAATVKRLLAVAVVWLAALALPLVLWLLYLAVATAGLVHKDAAIPAQVWLDGLSNWLAGAWFIVSWLHGCLIGMTVAKAYFWIAALFLFFASFLSANANSLHRLYRDKLSKAFLFNPFPLAPPKSDDADLQALDDWKLEQISPPSGGPYHLINAAVNLQNSKHANRRGRNAGFFTFSSLYVGGEATGYVATETISKADPNINLGTAMAISGAAVSSNMGSSSIQALAPTLALLNVRLGYWMINPRFAVGSGFFLSLADGFRRLFAKLMTWSGTQNPIQKLTDFVGTQWHNGPANLRRFLSDFLKGYLFAEMFGLLNESRPYIYLTDGGHIENLGLYALLKRHCDLIVVVDAECDAAMEFPALCKLERYARIDMGIRIDLPFDCIAAASAKPPSKPAKGPHCAVGIIRYPNGEKGALLYVKSSMTGDEPDYILHYQRHNPSFPHESTGDQFFSEEQFENYRALGFHALQGFLDGSDDFCMPDSKYLQPAELWGPAANAAGVRNYIKAMLSR